MLDNLSIGVGDKHNGKCVLKFGSWYFKPREIEIERAFLSSNAFRIGLSECLRSDLGYSAIDQFADLSLLRLSSNFGLARGFHPQDTNLTAEKFIPEKLGSIAAILLWFGFGDLHADNIKLGINSKSGNWYFSPIDLEILFEEIISLRQNLLLPIPDDLEPHLSGFNRLLDIISQNETDFIRGFSESLKSLEFNKSRILELLSKHTQILTSRIRVVLRPTADYRNYIQGKGCSEKYCFEEHFQLRNGDIPYFFRFLSMSKVFWIKNGKVIPADIDPLAYKIPRQLTYEEFKQRKRNISFLVEILKNDLLELRKVNNQN